MKTLTHKAGYFNSEALAEELLTAAELEAAQHLIQVTCNDRDCHGDEDPRHRGPVLMLVRAARYCRAEALGRPLEIGHGKNWLIVNCDQCGPLAWGAQDEAAGSEKIQTSHADLHRGHRVTVELFFREVVSEKIETAPRLDPPIYAQPKRTETAGDS